MVTQWQSSKKSNLMWIGLKRRWNLCWSTSLPKLLQVSCSTIAAYFILWMKWTTMSWCQLLMVRLLNIFKWWTVSEPMDPGKTSRYFFTKIIGIIRTVPLFAFRVKGPWSMISNGFEQNIYIDIFNGQNCNGNEPFKFSFIRDNRAN